MKIFYKIKSILLPKKITKLVSKNVIFVIMAPLILVTKNAAGQKI
jgi:hypothetical protein